MNAPGRFIRSLVLLSAALSAGTAQAFDLGDVGRFVGRHGDALVKSAQHLRKGFEEITAEEEHYIGRAVAARIMGRYQPIQEAEITDYLNTLGRYLTWFSGRPETWGGYHFMLVRSDEVNAFAAPGGYIMLTDGLLQRVSDEEQLAAVLAHEIAHVTLRHGLSAIQKSNLSQAFTLIGSEVAADQGGAGVRQLTSVFGDSVNDIINQLVVSGYSRKQEFEADREALDILHRSGYDPAGLPGFLTTLRDAAAGAPSAGFYKTHPPAGDRLEQVLDAVSSEDLAGETEPVRTERFARVTGR